MSDCGGLLAATKKAILSKVKERIEDISDIYHFIYCSYVFVVDFELVNTSWTVCQPAENKR